MPGVKGQRSGGHNAKTTAQHIADGTYKPHRHGKRLDNAEAVGTPVKPFGLSKQGEKLWKQFVEFLPPGCLGAIDSMALEELCRHYEQYDKAMRAWEADPLDKNARLAATAAWGMFWGIAQHYGPTPLARTRLQQAPKEEKKESPLDLLTRRAAERN